ncbi:gamma-glutamyl-gamma-aminobutyrate hydrolase family protein, partial [Candidatus Hydrogenedentota bacterium]
DIPAQLPQAICHKKDGGVEHIIEVSGDLAGKSLFRRKRFKALSSHHQCVKDAASGLVVAATAPDGVVEAVTMPDRRFVVGVQWHPELSRSQGREIIRQLVVAALGKS